MNEMQPLTQELTEKKPCHDCEKAVYQYAEVKTPVTVKPKALLGEIEAKCYGDPQVKMVEGPCKGACELMISQKICIRIPIAYEVETKVGPDCVNCGRGRE